MRAGYLLLLIKKKVNNADSKAATKNVLLDRVVAGSGKRHCGREYCKTQCPFPPLPLYVPGRCGVQAGGTKCPTGLCCSEDGWCGATEYHCNPQRCQSQCRNLTSSSTVNRYGGIYSNLPKILLITS